MSAPSLQPFDFRNIETPDIRCSSAAADFFEIVDQSDIVSGCAIQCCIEPGTVSRIRILISVLHQAGPRARAIKHGDSRIIHPYRRSDFVRRRGIIRRPE